VVASGVVTTGEGVPYARLEDRDRIRETLAVGLHELFDQGPGRLLTPDLEDGLEVLGYLAHLACRHAREGTSRSKCATHLCHSTPGSSPATAAFMPS
jgi:hypothetical protein